ncbi:MAG: putative toxin-antitoxin system toxin component, PIN family, partial [Actinomycetota bacterium]|nr:putative toxin-antitoxin system toxin component, PIN family [Actinomycetota bacterium]
MSASTSGKLVRATLDTNLFVSGLIRPGLPALLLDAWLARLFRLVTSEPLREEVAGLLVRPKFQRYGFTTERVGGILDALAAAEQAIPLAQIPVSVRDPKDVKVLACALGGRVDYLVTGDDDLHVLQGQPSLRNLRIVSAREFLTIIGSIGDKLDDESDTRTISRIRRLTAPAWRRNHRAGTTLN